MNAQRLKTINRVELMPNIPLPFQMRDWKALVETMMCKSSLTGVLMETVFVVQVGELWLKDGAAMLLQ